MNAREETLVHGFIEDIQVVLSMYIPFFRKTIIYRKSTCAETGMKEIFRSKLGIA